MGQRTVTTPRTQNEKGAQSKLRLHPKTEPDMYRPTLVGQHSCMGRSIGEDSFLVTDTFATLESERGLNDEPVINPALKVYDTVRLFARYCKKELGSFSLLEAIGSNKENNTVRIDLSALASRDLSMAELETVEIVICGTVCGGSNILFTRQYELTETGQVRTTFNDSPVPLRLLFKTLLRPDQMEEPGDLELDIDQVSKLECLEIEVGEEWRKLLTLIEHFKVNPTIRSQRPMLSKLRRSFRLSKRFSSKDLSKLDVCTDFGSPEESRSMREYKPTKEFRKVLKDCNEIRLQERTSQIVYSRIPLEPRCTQSTDTLWIVSPKDPTLCSVQTMLKMEIIRGGIAYQFREGRVKSDWTSGGRYIFKIHFNMAGLSWVSIRITASDEDRERLGQLMASQLAVTVEEFLAIVDREGVKCNVVSLAFYVLDVVDWFVSLGIKFQQD